MGSRLVKVEVEIDDIEDIETEDLLRELAYRGHDTVQDALTAIKMGRVHDGVAMLEREFFPRYGSVGECRAAYIRAMGGSQPEMSGGIDDFITQALGASIDATRAA